MQVTLPRRSCRQNARRIRGRVDKEPQRVVGEGKRPPSRTTRWGSRPPSREEKLLLIAVAYGTQLYDHTRENIIAMSDSDATQPQVGIIMGSRSDWETMQATVEILQAFDVTYESRVVSAHRTPQFMLQYAQEAESRGLRVIIAGAGGAAHLPGMVAACTLLPVLGVPVQSRSLQGLDSLLSIVQMPGGIPVGTLAIGTAGAKNAGLLAARILAIGDPTLRERLRAWMANQTQSVMEDNVL